MKTVLSAVILCFCLFAIAQLFKARALPNAVVYCVCAWIVARVRKDMI